MSRRREIVRDTLDFDGGDVLPGFTCVRPEHVMPLWKFPAWKRADIAEAVAQPKPPAKWLRLELGEIPSRAWAEWHWQRGIDPWGKRDAIPAAIRTLVMERDEMVCDLCGYFVDEADLHIDHIMPRSLGGSDLPYNLQVSHSWCNMRKGAKV